MKKSFAASLRLPLTAGALVLVVAGCGTMGHQDRSANRSVEPSGYVGQSSTPASVDPFSASYVPFPISANETAGITGHSTFCLQHYNQPGCQTFDSARSASAKDGRFWRHNRGTWSDSAAMNTGTDSTGGTSSPNRY